MELTPRYDAPDFLRYEGSFADPSVPLLRQRRRLGSTLAGLTDAQWAAPSRCDAWSVQEVITHLVDTNRFWALSITAGRNGEPTRFLDGFDPVATPAALVNGVGELAPATVLERYVESSDAIAAALEGLDGDGWSILAEAPPGHVPLRGVALHALWDSWVHERDIMLPLGLTPVEDADEITAILSYAACLSPAFNVVMGDGRHGSLVLETTDPDVRVVVEVRDGITVRDGDAVAPVDALHLTGPAVELLEALSCRAPLRQEVPADQRWLVDGVAQVFEPEPV